MKHLEEIPSQFDIEIPLDETGLFDCECPSSDCGKIFKIQPGTGLEDDDLPFHCPYCGHEEEYNEFITKAQVEYAESVVSNIVETALLKDLKSLEFNCKPQGEFGIGLSMKIRGRPTPVQWYQEEDLETEVVCDKCTLRYVIYGVFGFCPDCGIHNSLQILETYFKIIENSLTLSESQKPPISQQLIEDALKNCVSFFDGFGREICRVFGQQASNPEKVSKINFQNIVGAADEVLKEFGVSLRDAIKADEWSNIQHAFQKRHVLIHNMSVIDRKYQKRTGVSESLIGRRVTVTEEEIRKLLRVLRTISHKLYHTLAGSHEANEES